MYRVSILRNTQIDDTIVMSLAPVKTSGEKKKQYSFCLFSPVLGDGRTERLLFQRITLYIYPL